MKDYHGRKPVFSIPVMSKGREYLVSLFCDADGKPDFLRCKICNLETEEIPEDAAPVLQAIKEHFLSIMRIGYSSTFNYYPFFAYNFSEDEHSSGISLAITANENLIINPEAIKSLFTNSFEQREDVRLILDGTNEAIPLEYRFLSLYKFLENHLKKNNKWLEDELEQAIKPFEEQFRQAGFVRPEKTLHDIRDRCAHIKTKKQKPGITHLNYGQLAEAEKYLQILKLVCVEVLNKSVDSFQLGVHI